MTMGPTSRPGQAGSTSVDWNPPERTVERLLEALAAELVDEEVAELERGASVRRSNSELERSERQLSMEERDQARHELPTFRRALRDASEAGAAAVYDSSDPERDALADVLIRYLVRTGYAEVETESRAPGRHRYTIQIDWPRLGALADQLEERRMR